MIISYLQKACVSALFLVIALVSTHAIANQPQTFSGEIEKTEHFASNDVKAFAKLGDFIDPNNLELTVLSIESDHLSHSHPRSVKSVFFAYAPKDLHKAHRQISAPKSKEYISPSKASGPTIITIANFNKYRFKSLIKKHPDTIILISAGNDSQPNPGSAIRRYEKVSGKNIFHAGGTAFDGNLHIDKLSARPGQYKNAYIADLYTARTLKGKKVHGTSYSVQTIGVKLAVLYKALNVNHTWSMVDAMQLLMTTRNEKYSADLTKLLVRDDLLVKGDNATIYVGSDGKTRLLPEATLREMLSTSPLYKN